MCLEEYVTSDLSSELRNWYTTYFTGLNIREAERHPEASVARMLDVILIQYHIVGFLGDISSFISVLRSHPLLHLVTMT
jgi:hypothetical protein